MVDIQDLYNKSYRVLFYDSNYQYDYLKKELKISLKTNKNSNAFNNLGLAYLETNNIQLALYYFDLSTELDSLNSVAYINKAETYNALNNLEKAEENYSNAIKYDSTDPTYWRCRAQFFKDHNRLSDALFDLKQAFLLEPNFEATKEEITAIESILNKF